MHALLTFQLKMEDFYKVKGCYCYFALMAHHYKQFFIYMYVLFVLFVILYKEILLKNTLTIHECNILTGCIIYLNHIGHMTQARYQICFRLGTRSASGQVQDLPKARYQISLASPHSRCNRNYQSHLWCNIGMVKLKSQIHLR